MHIVKPKALRAYVLKSPLKFNYFQPFKKYGKLRAMTNIRIQEKFPRFVRWCHWINFPLLTLMVWSGILIYWANQAYIKIPESIVQGLGIDHKLSMGMGWHFFLLWPFVINGILYSLFLIYSGEWRELLPDRSSFKEAFEVLKHDLKIRKDAPPHRGKLNGAQRIVYTIILLIALGSLLTGLAIYKPVQLGWITTALGGYEAARFEHFLCMIIFIAFFLVHIAQVARAGWNNFRAMIAGYEVIGESNKTNNQE